MGKIAYLDNSATTPVCEPAKNKMIHMLELYGNPSSLHAAGLAAHRELRFARAVVAASLKAREDEIYFTSGGSESNNTAIFGAAAAKKRRGNRIITTDSEHPSVTECMKVLQNQGFEIVYLSTKNGMLDLDQLRDAADSRVILLSVMHTNNETGAVYNVREAAQIVREQCPEALVHMDCVQSYLKEEWSPASLSADLVSVSGHKVHAPKGVGALYIKKGVRILPAIYGGSQENSMRAGTENTPGIAAMGAAVEYLMGDTERKEQVVRLYSYLKERLSGLDFVKLNLPEHGTCYILNFSVPTVKSEVMLHFLSDEGVYVSSGSACSSKKGKSAVLLRFGLSDREVDSALRVSLSHYNTTEEIDLLINSLRKGYDKICKTEQYS